MRLVLFFSGRRQRTMAGIKYYFVVPGGGAENVNKRITDVVKPGMGGHHGMDGMDVWVPKSWSGFRTSMTIP